MHSHSSGTASDSICPKGWRLPGYDGSGSYYDLAQKYNNGTENKKPKDTIMQVYPLTIIRSGYYYYSDGKLYNRASFGYYWSGRHSSIVNSYYLDFSSTRLIPQNGSERGRSFSIRCLARWLDNVMI